MLVSEPEPQDRNADRLSNSRSNGHAGCPRHDTVRFAAYRTYQVSLDSARLGITSHDQKATVPRRRGASAADVTAARSELAAYYVRCLGKSQPQATAMAADAINALMNTAQEWE